MAAAYEFIGAEQVVELVPPASTQQVQQVTARATESGIVFLASFGPDYYARTADVAEYLAQLANGFDQFANVPGVVSIGTIQTINPANQLVNMIDVTVRSTSGKSTTTFEWSYPTVDFFAPVYSRFVAEVDRQIAVLDAVENA